MTQLDATEVGDDFAPVRLDEVVMNECAFIENCSFEGEEALILGNARMLRHMVRNLLDNAMKHGVLPIFVSIESSEVGISLKVADSGAGISPTDLEHVFEPFYRGAGKQNVPGNGLGLALVARIAKADGAKVNIVRHPRSATIVMFPNNARGV